MKPGLYQVSKLGEWAVATPTANWTVEIEVERNHERLTTGLLLVDASDAQHFLRGWRIGADEYVAQRALEYAIGQWLLRMLKSGVLPEGTLQVGREVIERATSLMADQDRREEFETRYDGPGLAVYGTSQR